MSDTWEQIRARLEAVIEDWEAHKSEDATELLDDYDMECLRAALERDEHQTRAAMLREIDCANLEAERNDLRQRVEELEGTPRCCADTIPPGCRSCRCANAAEAKLAQVVELADHQIPFYAYGDNEAAVEMAHRLESILAAARGGE